MSCIFPQNPLPTRSIANAWTFRRFPRWTDWQHQPLKEPYDNTSSPTLNHSSGLGTNDDRRLLLWMSFYLLRKYSSCNDVGIIWGLVYGIHFPVMWSSVTTDSSVKWPDHYSVPIPLPQWRQLGWECNCQGPDHTMAVARTVAHAA